MDPEGCYMSNEMLDTLHHDLGTNTEVILGEAPWDNVDHRCHHETGETNSNTSTRWIRDEMPPVKRVFCKL